MQVPRGAKSTQLARELKVSFLGSYLMNAIIPNTTPAATSPRTIVSSNASIFFLVEPVFPPRGLTKKYISILTQVGMRNLLRLTSSLLRQPVVAGGCTSVLRTVRCATTHRARAYTQSIVLDKSFTLGKYLRPYFRFLFSLPARAAFQRTVSGTLSLEEQSCTTETALMYWHECGFCTTCQYRSRTSVPIILHRGII